MIFATLLARLEPDLRSLETLVLPLESPRLALELMWGGRRMKSLLISLLYLNGLLLLFRIPRILLVLELLLKNF